MTEEVKRKRGRPRKEAAVEVAEASVPTKEEQMQAVVREALTADTGPTQIVERPLAPVQETVAVACPTRPNSITVQELFHLMRNR